MNWNEYVPLAIRTAKPLEEQAQLDHAYLGMITELGELADAIKRQDIYGKPLDVVNLKEEAGDFAWYVALYCDVKKLDVQLTSSGMYRPFNNQGLMFEMHSLIGCLVKNITGTEPEYIVSYLLLAVKTLLERHGIKLEDALATNIGKLAARYGDAYSDYRALNRNLDSERAILES